MYIYSVFNNKGTIKYFAQNFEFNSGFQILFEKFEKVTLLVCACVAKQSFFKLQQLQLLFKCSDLNSTTFLNNYDLKFFCIL